MKKTTILINGKPFTYDDEIEDITYETIGPITENDARALLEKTKELFDKCGIRFSLAFGTLLGAVRDGTIIKGDEDVDIFVESEEELRSKLPFLYDNGLRVCRINEKYVYSFRVNSRSFIDVYFKAKLPLSVWSLWCDSLLCKAVPRRYISKYDKITFLGIECLCPHKPERILSFWYGKDWRIPVRGHSFTYESPSRYWWKTKGKKRYETCIYLLKLLLLRPHVFLQKLFKRIYQLILL